MAINRDYGKHFYEDLAITLEASFPFRSFATRHNISVSDAESVFFGLVTMPLANPNEYTNKFRFADGARNLIKKWNKDYKEVIKNIRANCTEEELEEERQWKKEQKQFQAATSKKRKLDENNEKQELQGTEHVDE